MVNQKARDIGIRKVVGASVTSILVLLNRDFVKLIVLAFVVALPFAWYMADSWLSDFQYRVTFNALLPVIAVLATLLVSLVTVSLKTYQAAQTNPVHTLKDE
jgi:putative ABC transport system permease protein